MKKLTMFIVGLFTALAMTAQNTAGTVTINVKGDRNKEIMVDGQSYTVSKDVSATTAVNMPITISSLSPGQHTLSINRSNAYNNTTSTGNTTTFNLRNGYDLEITINSNGSVSLTETRIRRGGGNTGTYRRPMSSANFNALLVNIQNTRGNNARLVAINNAFNNSSNYFTTTQASQLIMQVTSQASRLSLAKASYRSITDPVNFNQISDLIVSQAGKRDLEDYVRTYNINFPTTGGTTHVAMSDVNFNSLYTDAQGQWQAAAKTTYLANVFANSSNYFTTAQVKQLIEVVYPEADRLTLAKAAYDNVVDPANFTQISDLLSYQSSRNELANFISQTGTVNPKAPMSATNFNSLYLSVRDKYSNSDKIYQLTSSFANTGNYFTTTQVKQLIQLVNMENDRLTLAKASWDNLTDPANASQLYDLFPTTAYRNDFAAYVNSNGTYTGSTVLVPMSEANFNSLYNSISSTYGLGAKMSSLSDVFNVANNSFTVAQLRQLIPLVSSETNRLQLSKLAYNNAVDPENYGQLYELLATQTSRNELDAYVKSNSTGVIGYTPVKTPMSGDAFTTLYNNINSTWGLGAKMSALTDVFANASNYFTTTQAKQLIQLVSLETNRLQLAKSSYDNITDPENFSQVYDLFTSQANRNELAAYVNSYSYNR